MKKIFILLLICAAAFWGYKNFGSALSRSEAFDEQGRPKVILFTYDDCEPCVDVSADLRSRNVAFEEVNGMTDDGRSRMEKFGDPARFPLTVIGARAILGNDLLEIESVLAEALGMDVLTPAVQRVMRNHFDEQGNPRVVLYGTTTCPHCKRMRAYLEGRAIAYQFVDVFGMGDGSVAFSTLRGIGYPLIYVGYRRIDGYDERKVDQAVSELLKGGP